MPLKRLGLTGSIGAGKSTVARLLRERDLVVLDADEQARLVTEEPEILAELAQLFPSAIKEDKLDRSALGQIVFGHPEKLQQLNALIHPRVRQRMQTLERDAAQAGAKWVVQDIPLLFESGLEKNMDAVWVVDAPLETRITRVIERSGLSRKEILERDAKQMPISEKRQRATLILENYGSLQDLSKQVDQALSTLFQEASK